MRNTGVYLYLNENNQLKYLGIPSVIKEAKRAI